MKTAKKNTIFHHQNYFFVNKKFNENEFNLMKKFKKKNNENLTTEKAEIINDCKHKFWIFIIIEKIGVVSIGLEAIFTTVTER